MLTLAGGETSGLAGASHQGVKHRGPGSLASPSSSLTSGQQYYNMRKRALWFCVLELGFKCIDFYP